MGLGGLQKFDFNFVDIHEMCEYKIAERALLDWPF